MARDAQRELLNWQWPPADQYPLNNKDGTVEKWIRRDLKASQKYLFLIGFSSLEYLIEEFGREEVWQNQSVEIVLGNEPILREEVIKKRLNKSKHKFSNHIADYWLKENP